MKNLKQYKTILYGSRLNISLKVKNKSKFSPCASAFGFFAPLQKKPLFHLTQHPLLKAGGVIAKQRQRQLISTFVPFAYPKRVAFVSPLPLLCQGQLPLRGYSPCFSRVTGQSSSAQPNSFGCAATKSYTNFCPIRPLVALQNKRGKGEGAEKKREIPYSKKFSRTALQPNDFGSFHKFEGSSNFFFFVSFSLKNSSKRPLCGLQTFSLKNEKSFIRPFAGSSKNYWKKRISAAYFLLIAYKQTALAKWKLYLNSPTTKQLVLALSPFLIYYIQTSLERYDLKFQSDLFIQRSLPQWNFGTPSQKLTWETFAYTKYSNKLNAHSIKEINCFDNSIFISLNPVWQLEQKQLKFCFLDLSTESMTTNGSFLSSRYFFQFHSLISENKLRFLIKPHGLSLISKKQTNLCSPRRVGANPLQSPFLQWNNLNSKGRLNIEWQFFFDELDDIPMKLSSVFYETPSSFETILSSGVDETDSSFETVLSSGFDETDSSFETSETNLEMKLLFSFPDVEANLHTASELSSQTCLKDLETTPSKITFNTKEINLVTNPLTDFFFVGDESLPSSDLKDKKTSTISASSEGASSLWLAKQPEILPSLEKDLDLDSSCIPLKQTWIDRLNEIFFFGFKKSENPLFLERAFHYNIDFGLSTFAKFPKLLALQPITLKRVDSAKETVSLEKGKNSIPLPSVQIAVVGTTPLEKPQLFKGDDKNDLFSTNSKKKLNSSFSNEKANDKELSYFDWLLKNAFLNWKKVIRQDLKRPSPLWSKKLKRSEFVVATFPTRETLQPEASLVEKSVNSNSGLNANSIDLTLHQPSGINEVLPHSKKKIQKKGRTTELVQIKKFENLFLKQLKVRFNDSLIDAVMADPESVLTLLKKTTLPKSEIVPVFHKDKTTQKKISKPLAVEQTNTTSFHRTPLLLQEEKFRLAKQPCSQNQSSNSWFDKARERINLVFLRQNTKAKGLLNFEKINISKDLNEHFLTQRKLSGYLYPDSSRTNISLNLNRFKKSNNLELHKLLKNSEIIPAHPLKKEKPFVLQANSLNQIKSKSSKGFYSSSLIQIEQPLLPLISNKKIDKVDYKPQHLSSLRLQTKENRNQIPNKSILDWIPSNRSDFNFFFKDIQNQGTEGGKSPIFQIKPDSSLTSNQDGFFAGPTKRRLFQERPVNRTKVVKPILKYERRAPYVSFSEQILKLTELGEHDLGELKEHDLGELGEHDLGINTVPLLEARSNKSPVTEENGVLVFPTELSKAELESFPRNNRKLQAEKLALDLQREATKEKLVSVVMKEKDLNRLFLEQKPIQIKNFKGLREKTLDLISSPLSYKKRFYYTTAKKVQPPLFFDNLPLLPLEKNFLLNKRLVQQRSSLYEPLSLKTWSVLSQFGFIFLVFKGLFLIKDEYIEEWNYYLKDFQGLLSEIGESLLEIPTQSDNFRVIEKTQKKFSDLVGGRFLLNEFGDIILLLRNSRKQFCKIQISPPTQLKDGIFNQQESSLFNSNGFKMEDLTSKGILLIGPPGTGKTLLVQALSGEANVPIIIESGKKLNSTLEIPGVERLKDLFQKARTMSPCLLFLDEIDTIGQKRPNVISSLSSLNKQTEIPNILNLLYFQNTPTSAFTENELNKIDKTGSTSFLKSTWNSLNPLLQFQIKSPSTKKTNNNQISEEQEIKDFIIQISDEKIVRGENQERDLIMLTQLLCELDGLNQRKNVIVIGATNRPATLDSALIRPGRLGKIIYLDLPGKQKRFDLLKFYSHLGVDDSINWDYFANQTVGLSAAHLSAAMNRSALKTIYSFLYRKNKKPNFAATLTQIVKSSSAEKTFSNLLTKGFLNKTSSKSLFFKRETNKRKKGSASFSRKSPFFSLEVLKTTWNYTKSKFLFFLPFIGTSAKARGQTKQIKASNKLALISPKQKQPQHTLETIEYGIQTVSTINTHSQQSFSKGKQTNKKTFGHAFPLFLAHSIKFNKKLILKSTKLDVIVNTIFNQPHFLSILNIWETKPFKKSRGSFAILVDNFGFTRRPETQNIKFKSNNVKKSFENRKLFYTKQRQYLRTLALLENRNDKFKKNRLSGNRKSKISPPRSFAVRESGFYLKKFNLLDRYLSRITENQFFGWLFLFNSTCAIHNPIFLASFQTKFWSLQTKKPNQAQMERKKNFLYYNILSLDSVGHFDYLDSCAKKKNSFFSTSSIFHPDKLKTGSSLKTLLTWQNNHFTNQLNLFGDSLFLNRSAYYLSGKSIINLVVVDTFPTFPLFPMGEKQGQVGKARAKKKLQPQVIPNKLDQPVYLWSFITSTQVRQKRKTYDHLNKNKLEFEKVLLSFIAGKASETLMLKNQIGILKQNNSDIGTNELKEFSALIRLMIDKYLFYSQKRVTRQQVNRNFLANGLQTQQNNESFLKKLTNLFENPDANNNLLANSNSPFYDEFLLGDTPWWQLKLSQLLTVTNLKYSEWYNLFLINPAQNLRNIEWSSPDSFYHNQVNNRYLISNQNKLSNFDLEKELNHFFINREIVLKYIVFSNLNWNQLQLLELDFLTTSFLFESFNKAFYLLESHRELLDVLVYSLFCQEKMKEFQMKNFYEHYIK